MEALTIARAADEFGFDELWIGEMATFDAFALAGAVARDTSRIRLVVGPLPVALRDPVALAMGSTSVTELGGRASDLVLGASSPTVLSDWHGIDAPATLQAFTDTVAVLRSLFRGERTDHHLATARSRGFRLRLAPGATVSLGMAAFGPNMVDLATSIADRIVLAHVSPTQVAAIRSRVDRRAAELGRSAPLITVWMAAALDDEQTAQVMRGLVTYVGQRGYRTMFAEAGFGDLVDLSRSGAGPKRVLDAMPVDLARTVAGVGDPSDVRARIAELGAAGADRVCIVPATAGDASAARVLEALRPT